MGEKKVTKMVLKVELSCSKCRKKVKKALGKFPEIQEQSFDEKTNTVTIKVVSSSPEKIRDKLCCKGDGSIKTIVIPEKDSPSKNSETTSKTTTTTADASASASASASAAAAAAAAAINVNVINSVGACESWVIWEANPAWPCTIM